MFAEHETTVQPKRYSLENFIPLCRCYVLFLNFSRTSCWGNRLSFSQSYKVGNDGIIANFVLLQFLHLFPSTDDTVNVEKLRVDMFYILRLNAILD